MHTEFPTNMQSVSTQPIPNPIALALTLTLTPNLVQGMARPERGFAARFRQC